MSPMTKMSRALRRFLLAPAAAVILFGLGPAIALAQEGGEHPAEVAAEDAHGEHGAAEGHGHHEDPTRSYNFFDFTWWQHDAAGGPLGDGKIGDEPLPAGEKEPTRGPPFALLVFNFAIVLWILWKWGAPAARKMAESRSDLIKDALDEAARLRQQAKAKLEEYNVLLKAAETEISQMVDGMRRDAEAEKQRIIAAAETQAAALKRDAEQRIAAEIDRARTALQREVAAVSAEVAEKLLREKATPADQAKMVDAFIQDVAQPRAGVDREV